MSGYHRLWISGGCYFFTAVTWKRSPVFADAACVDMLRASFRKVMQQRPFRVDAMVVLPDHVHCIWRLPAGDTDYSSRWREIKKATTRKMRQQSQNPVQIWQKRFWEHAIRDERDWRNHMDYIHYNPVKHGLVSKPRDWPYSSLNKCMAQGWYENDWGNQQEPKNISTFIE